MFPLPIATSPGEWVTKRDKSTSLHHTLPLPLRSRDLSLTLVSFCKLSSFPFILEGNVKMGCLPEVDEVAQNGDTVLVDLFVTCKRL